MIKDFLVSFGDNFKEKTRNPFLGTYLLVWLIRNWELVYSLFNFDKGFTLEDKVSFINSYYAKINFINNIVSNIIWAILLLIITYILLNLSRFIINLFEKQLTPWIYKITDSKSIVLKSVYLNMVSERDDLQSRLDQERESKSRLESRIKKLEEDLITAATINPLLVKETPTTKTKDVKETSTKKDEPTRILLQKIKEKNRLQDYMDIAVMVNKGEGIHNKNEKKDYFIELGLLTFEKNHSYNAEVKYYKLTSDGENVLKLARLE